MAVSTDRLRFGVLGVAHINDRLFPAFPKTRYAQLHAIASRDSAKAEAAAQAAGIPKFYGSYDALLDDPDIQAVYIPLPNHLHGEYTRKAADHGKHVLCEKPLTPTAVEADALVAYCHIRNVRLMDGFMWPHHPRTQVIRKVIDQGKIGRVQHVSASFTFKMASLETGNIRLNPGMGGGSLLDVGCYPVSGIRWAFGTEPIEAYARAVYHRDCDISLAGHLRFVDGRMANFDCAFNRPLRQTMEIAGELGHIRIEDMWLPDAEAKFSIVRGAEVETHHVAGHDQIALMIDDFALAVLEKREAYPSPKEAVKTLKVLDALAKSARSGQPEAID
jgi:D-xylose 1-dehydrogenase (NADP+, D-xylono-1,5-lactone-forming)